MFESGIKDYTHHTAEIEVYFPVDDKGRAHETCQYCQYFGSFAGKCKITDEVIYRPTDFVGYNCPFREKEDI